MRTSKVWLRWILSYYLEKRVEKGHKFHDKMRRKEEESELNTRPSYFECCPYLKPVWRSHNFNLVPVYGSSTFDSVPVGAYSIMVWPQLDATLLQFLALKGWQFFLTIPRSCSPACLAMAPTSFFTSCANLQGILPPCLITQVGLTDLGLVPGVQGMFRRGGSPGHYYFFIKINLILFNVLQ